MPSRVLPSTQLSLALNRSPLPTPIAVPEKAVSALADLLLAAVGHGVEAEQTEGDDEQQDHR
jgi:hypothetical protein